MSAIQYNRSIRKLVIAFGNLFNNLTLVRYNKNLTEQERILVPISYAPKELYVKRLETDPNLDKKTQITLPRLSFEMTGLAYDTDRKLNTNVRNFAGNASTLISQYNPVPYDFDFNLYLYVRNIEDGTQLIERILSNFTPDYTVKIDMIPEMSIVKEVPIILNSATQEIEYEGNRDSETRTIIWTLSFTIKGYIFGERTTSNVITNSIITINNKITQDDVVRFNMSANTGYGDYQFNEMVYQGYSLGTASATASVTDWNNNTLYLNNINGNFMSTLPIIGSRSLASYMFSSYQTPENQFVEIDLQGNTISKLITTTITEGE
jgi:hypothetical protein